jgi:ubiquinone/menaquinone biosynthesis C-methylase UbiE
VNHAYKALLPLIEKKGKITDPEQFHSIVNVVFHDREAGEYDELHKEMWESLPYQYQLMVQDISTHIPANKQLKVLDIGCGTGLATEMLLGTDLRENICEIHLLDTSSAMLEEAKKRADNWGKSIKIIHGDISVVDDKYDLIIISSVLHHIPDLTKFLTNVSRVQNTEGILLTIHDPSLEALESSSYAARCAKYRDYYQNNQQTQSASLIARIINKVKRLTAKDDYITVVNKRLLDKNVIKEPLTETELWSITDIHVEGLPYSATNGVAKQVLSDALTDYEPISYRTYAFYGTLRSNLIGPYGEQEDRLSQEGDLYGRNFASAWLKNIK